MARSRAVDRAKQADKKVARLSVETNELPHEFLLRISRGEPIVQKRLVIKYYEFGPDAGKVMSREWVDDIYYPDFNTRVAAAKNAAPYYAPRLSAQSVNLGNDSAEALTTILKDLSGELPT